MLNGWGPSSHSTYHHISSGTSQKYHDHRQEKQKNISRCAVMECVYSIGAVRAPINTKQAAAAAVLVLGCAHFLIWK